MVCEIFVGAWTMGSKEMAGTPRFGDGASITRRYNSRNGGINRRNGVKSNFSIVCISLCLSSGLKRDSGAALFVSVDGRFLMVGRW